MKYGIYYWQRGICYTMNLKGILLKKPLIVVKKSLIILLSGFLIAIDLANIRPMHLVDFTAFYGAAKHILVGLTPYRLYETFYGGSIFQSPFWIAWLFVPLTIFPINSASTVFGLINLLISLVCLIVILRWHTSKVSPLTFIYLLGCTWALSRNTILFGQVTIIQLFAVIMIISAIKAKRPFLAGLALPLVIIKPHLVLFFLIAALRRGGRRMLLAGIGSTVVLILIAFLTQHSWITDMLQVVIYGQQISPMEWNKFVTIGGLFSLPPVFSYVTWLLTLPILIYVNNKFRSLPTTVWLPIALVLSLATAPYAFAYDLPLLLPALVWLCLPLTPLSFTVAFAIAFIPYLAGFSSIAYIAVIIIALYSIRGAILQMRLQVNESTSF